MKLPEGKTSGNSRKKDQQERSPMGYKISEWKSQQPPIGPPLWHQSCSLSTWKDFKGELKWNMKIDPMG